MNMVWREFTRGGWLRGVFVWGLRILAVLTALAGLTAWVVLWIALFRRANVGLIVGSAIDLVIYIFALYGLVHTLWYRSNRIARRKDDDLPAFGVTAIVSRLIGELSAIVLAYVAIAGAILVWASGRRLEQFIAGFPRALHPFGVGLSSGIFLVGFGVLVTNLIRAALVLLFAYFIAELIRVLAGIYLDTRAIRQSVEKPKEPGG